MRLDGPMSGESSTETPLSRTGRWVVVALIALAVVVFVVVRVQAIRAQDVRVDELYCTLSGVSVFDTGPNTGRMCADLLND